MLKSLLRDENNQFQVVTDLSAISNIVEDRSRLLWLDLERPTLDEFRLIQDEFSLHPLAIEDAMAAHPRPKVDQYDNFYLVVFYLVNSSSPESRIGQPDASSADAHDVLRPGSDGRAEFHNLVRAASAGQAVAATPNGQVNTHVGQAQAGHAGHAGHAAGLGEPTSVTNAEDAVGLRSMSDRILLRELTMFMGENYLITVHNDPIPEFAEVARRWRQNVAIIKPSGPPTPGADPVPGCRHLTAPERANLEVRVGLAPDVPKHPALPGTETPATQGDSGGSITGSSLPVAQSSLNATNTNRSSGVYRPSRNGSGNGNGARARHKQQGEIGILLYSMLDTIVDEYFPVVDAIVDRVEDLEEEIFERYNQGAIESIFSLKKDLLALRKVLAPERDVLNILVRRDLPLFDQQTLLYFQDIYDHVVRITDSIDTYRDLLSSALDGFLSMQSNRLNITVQTLTSVSIMLMSVALVTGWYGMNFQNMPELSAPYGYPITATFIIAIVVVEYLFFRRKGWL